MSEHTYLTPEALSMIGSCSPTGPFAIAVHWIIADLAAVRDELKAAQEQFTSSQQMRAVLLSELEKQSAFCVRLLEQRREKDAEIARLRVRAENAEALFANAANLDDCEEIRSRDRQLNRLRKALEDIACGVSSDGAVGIAKCALGPQPAQPEKPKPQTFREGHPVYVCRQCSKQYKEHGKNEECPVGERGKEVK